MPTAMTKHWDQAGKQRLGFIMTKHFLATSNISSDMLHNVYTKCSIMLLCQANTVTKLSSQGHLGLWGLRWKWCPFLTFLPKQHQTERMDRQQRSGLCCRNSLRSSINPFFYHDSDLLSLQGVSVLCSKDRFWMEYHFKLVCAHHVYISLGLCNYQGN